MLFPLFRYYCLLETKIVTIGWTDIQQSNCKIYASYALCLEVFITHQLIKWTHMSAFFPSDNNLVMSKGLHKMGKCTYFFQSRTTVASQNPDKENFDHLKFVDLVACGVLVIMKHITFSYFFFWKFTLFFNTNVAIFYIWNNAVWVYLQTLLLARYHTIY